MWFIVMLLLVHVHIHSFPIEGAVLLKMIFDSSQSSTVPSLESYSPIKLHLFWYEYLPFCIVPQAWMNSKSIARTKTWSVQATWRLCFLRLVEAACDLQSGPLVPTALTNEWEQWFLVPDTWHFRLLCTEWCCYMPLWFCYSQPLSRCKAQSDSTYFYVRFWWPTFQHPVSPVMNIEILSRHLQSETSLRGLSHLYNDWITKCHTGYNPIST